jgi:hypothetical protein
MSLVSKTKKLLGMSKPKRRKRRKTPPRKANGEFRKRR